MKVKVLKRDKEAMTRERKEDLMRVHHNPNPELHPFERAREYTRALQATKLDKIFAKPFIGALSGHSDGVYTMARSPVSLTQLVSGAADGEVRVWNLRHRTTVRTLQAHTGFVKGVVVSADGRWLYTCSVDKTVKLWSMAGRNVGGENEVEYESDVDEDEAARAAASVSSVMSSHTVDKADKTWVAAQALTSIDHHKSDATFATCGTTLQLWNDERSEPVQAFDWGTESLYHVRYNPVQHNVLASCGSDRSINLYDVRAATPVRKLIMAMRANAVAWNPREAFNFTAASEDHNLYTYDMRKLDHARMVHKDHVSAVLDVDYSPTGKEFVSGSYDRTLRIFRVDSGKSREVYHTKRMQRIFCVKYSPDAQYVLSGSDDTNIRLWKARASKAVGLQHTRNRASLEYKEKLKRRYAHMPEIKRIATHRHVPKAIHNAKKLKQTMKESATRKEKNVRRHTRPGQVVKRPERKRRIIREVE